MEERKFGIEAFEWLRHLKENGTCEEEILTFLFTLGGIKDGETRREFSISICGMELWYNGQTLCDRGSGSRGRISKAFYNWIMDTPSGGPEWRAVFDRHYPVAP